MDTYTYISGIKQTCKSFYKDLKTDFHDISEEDLISIQKKINNIK